MTGVRATVALAAMLGSPCAAAQDGSTWCFPSGFRLAAVQRTGSPVVGVATVVDGGSSAEQPGEEGAAHVLEHLWFRSPRVGAATFDDLIASTGAEANAYTTHDETIYVTVAPKRAIRALLAAEGERLQDPLGAVDEATIQTELRVVRNELAERFEGKDPAIRAVLSRFVPDDHPYARSVGGTGAQVDALDRDKLVAYGKRAYLPANTTLYVTGDLDPAAVLRLVMSSIPPEVTGGTGIACPVIDDAWPEGLVDTPVGDTWAVHEVGVEEPTSVVAWSVPSGFASADIASTAAQLMQWRLERKGIEAVCDTAPLRRMTLLSCEAPAQDQDDRAIWDEALKAVRTLWNQATAERDSRADYWDAVTRYLVGYQRAGLRRGAEVLTPGGYLADAAVEFHRSGGRAGHGGVSAEQAAAFAEKWLTPERMRGARLVPMAGAESLASSFHGGRGAAENAGDEVVDATPERLAQLVVDPGLDAVLVGDAAGRAVWVLEAANAVESRMSAVYPVDPAQDTAARDLGWRLLHTTYDRLPPSTQSDLIQGHGSVFAEALDHAWVQTAIDDDPNLVMRVLGAALKADVSLAPQAAEKQRLRELETWQAEAAGNASWVAAHLRWKALAGGLPHPLLDGSAATVERAAGLDAARKVLDRSGAHLVAVVPRGAGPAVLDGLVRLSRAGEVRQVERPDRIPAEAAPRSVTVLASDDPGPQAVVTLECHVTDGDAASWWILERLLREALGGSLRNDLGLTYGVHPSGYDSAHGVVLRVGTRVPHDAAGIATRSILAALDATAAGEVDATRIDRYKVETARQTALRWQDPDVLLSVLQDAAASGWQPDQLGLAERIARVDAAALAARLAPCTGREAITIVGDAEAVGDALDKAAVPWSPRAP